MDRARFTDPSKIMKYFDFILKEYKVDIIITRLKNTPLEHLEIVRILLENGLSLHHLESDLFNVFKNPITSKIYIQCILADLKYYSDLANLNILEETIRLELNALIADLEEIINTYKLNNRRLISISFEPLDTVSLEFIRND